MGRTPFVLSLVALLAACSDATLPSEPSADAGQTAADATVADAGAGPPDAAPDAGAGEDAAAADAAGDAAAPDADPATAAWEEAELPAELERWGATVARAEAGRYYLYGGLKIVRRALVTSSDLMEVDMRGDAPVITQVTTTSTPPGRSRACAAFDPVGQPRNMRGGRASGRALNNGTTWVLDARTGAWTGLETAAGPPGLVGCVMTYSASDRAIYHFGGAFERPDFTWSNELWRFDLASETWSRVATTGTSPAPAYDATLAEHEGTLLLFGGGIGVPGSGEFRADLHAFDLAQGRWNRLATGRARPEGRRGHWMLVSADGQRILVGGGESVEDSLDDVWLYDRARSVWEDLTPEGANPAPLAQGPFATALPGPAGATVTIYSGIGDPTGAPSDQAWRLSIRGLTF
jgi:hypothetical protein